LWQGIGVVSQLEWIVTHLPHNAVAWLQETFQTGIAAVSWSLLLNIILLTVGVTLVIFSFRESKAAPRPLPLDPKPKKKIDPKERINTVGSLLLRFLKEGQALIGGVDAKLLIDWETRTATFIRDAFSEDEVKRFYSNDGSAYRVNSERYNMS